MSVRSLEVTGSVVHLLDVAACMFSPAECPDSHSSRENTNKQMLYAD